MEENKKKEAPTKESLAATRDPAKVSLALTHESFAEIEAANQEIDMWFPSIEQDELYMRIRVLKEYIKKIENIAKAKGILHINGIPYTDSGIDKFPMPNWDEINKENPVSPWLQDLITKDGFEKSPYIQSLIDSLSKAGGGVSVGPFTWEETPEETVRKEIEKLALHEVVKK